jgi:hypothetical protein
MTPLHVCDTRKENKLFAKAPPGLGVVAKCWCREKFTTWLLSKDNRRGWRTYRLCTLPLTLFPSSQRVTGTSPHLDPLCTLAPIKSLLNIEEVLTLVSNLSWTNLFHQTLVTVLEGISPVPLNLQSATFLYNKKTRTVWEQKNISSY